MHLAVIATAMARVFGTVGGHAGRQSIEQFKKMFLALLGLAMFVAFSLGVLLTALITLHAKPFWLFIPLTTAIFLCFVTRYASRRLDEHEKNRLNWRKGALGEYEVGAELERLSNNYSIFNDLNTVQFGNFDHIVIGPTGIFVLETKNWRGLVQADCDGELIVNGVTRNCVRNLERKLMTLREQILVLTQTGDLFVKGVIVFPKAHVDAPFGKTRNVHCLTIERLYDYIEQARKRFEPQDVDQLVRAVNGIAGMDATFGQVKNSIAELATA